MDDMANTVRYAHLKVNHYSRKLPKGFVHRYGFFDIDVIFL
jgi:hypothetical protein